MPTYKFRGIIADPSHAALELFAQSGEDEASRIVRVNGTYNKSSPYRGPPSREVDTAWERYWKTWMFGVDEKAYLASRPEHPSAAVRLPDGQYLATFEATHQLHCLYNLFRASYRDHYSEEQADYEENTVRWHERVDHCVEVLRQKLEWYAQIMILALILILILILFFSPYPLPHPIQDISYTHNSRWSSASLKGPLTNLYTRDFLVSSDRDTTILTYNWVEGRTKPVLNFNAARICPNWGPLDDFAQRRRTERMPTKPKDAVGLARIP